MIETEFTPWASLTGGAMIGLATVLLMLTAGRILGATGILTGAMYGDNGQDRGWRLAVLAGMLVSAPVYLLLTGGFPAIEVPVTKPMIALGGLLVGAGVYFSSGCTSGHGVCGLSRLSPRSFVAVPVFMVACAATVFVIRHVIGG